MPVLDKSDEKYLKPWLVRTLEPICDADPEVLGDYILALLKHDEPESQLRKGLEKELQDFLESETPPFVDKLFNTLRSKSFVPYDDSKPSSKAGPSTAAAATSTIPIPIDSINGGRSIPTGPRGTKRNADDDSQFSRPPPKGPRMSAETGRNSSERGPPSSRGGGDHRGGRGDGQGAGPSRGGAFIPQSRSGKPKEPCRDYHNIGYCPRGELCPYDHGEEAIVPQMPFGAPGPNGMPMNPMQMMSLMANGFPMPWMMDPSMTGAYNPNDAMMDMSSGSSPSFANNNRRNTKFGPTDAIELTSPQPNPTLRSQPSTSDPHSSNPLVATPMAFDPSSTIVPVQNGFNPNAGLLPVGESPSFIAPQNGYRGGRGGAGRGRGRGRGQPLHSEPGSFPTTDGSFTDSSTSESPAPERNAGKPQNKTIVVEKIPKENLSMSAVSEWFSRFGTVTNVAIDVPTSKALVSFAAPSEARAAWGTQEAVFGNRFVKLFWHRPLAGKGEVGAQRLAASAPLVQGATPSTTPSIPTSSKPTAPPSLTPAQSIAARKELLEAKIAEQKALMASLSSATTSEEKKEIMTKLRALSDEMKATSKPATSISTTAPNGKSASPSISEPNSTPSAPSVDANGSDRQTALLAKLAELKKQAAEVGVSSHEIDGESNSASSTYPWYSRGRGFTRGRARGRGSFGRGAAIAPAARSMKLDNRPKKLVVRGVNTENDGVVSAIEGFYKAVGVLDSFQVTGDDEVEVQFQTRAMAEQGIAKGSPPGSTSVSWHSTASVRSAPVSASTSIQDISMDPPKTSETATKDPLKARSSNSPPSSTTASAETSVPSIAPVLEAIVSGEKLGISSEVTGTQPFTSVEGKTADHDDDIDGGWGAGGGFDD